MILISSISWICLYSFFFFSHENCSNFLASISLSLPILLTMLSTTWNDKDVLAVSLLKNLQWCSDPSCPGASSHSFLSLSALGTLSWLQLADCCCFPASAYPFSKPEWPPHGFLPSKLALMSLLRSLPRPSQTGVGSLPRAAPHPVITVTTSSCNLIPAHFPPSMVNVSRQRNVTCQVDTVFHPRVLRRSCPHQKEHR